MFIDLLMPLIPGTVTYPEWGGTRRKPKDKPVLEPQILIKLKWENILAIGNTSTAFERPEVSSTMPLESLDVTPTCR